jgi:hypothetical protein
MVIRKSRRRRRSPKRRKSPKKRVSRKKKSLKKPKKRVSRKKKSLKKPKKRVSKRRSKHNKKYLTSCPSETKPKSEPTKRGEHLTTSNIRADWGNAYNITGLKGTEYATDDAPFQIRELTDPEPESRSFY